jgi:hypothetical protein
MSVELDVRQWLRTNSAVVGQVVSGDRVDFGYEGANPGTRIRLFRSGGGPDAIVNVDRALMTFQCFGSSRKAADDLAGVLVRELRRLHTSREHPLRVAEPAGPVWSPDEAGHAMYSVTALVTAKMTAPAV